MEIKNRLSPLHCYFMDVDIDVEGVINNVIGALNPTLAALFDKVGKLLMDGQLWK